MLAGIPCIYNFDFFSVIPSILTLPYFKGYISHLTVVILSCILLTRYKDTDMQHAVYTCFCNNPITINQLTQFLFTFTWRFSLYHRL